MDFVVARTFNSLYIGLDIVWLLMYAGLLLYFRKQQAIVVGLVMGLVYFLIDYGVFFQLLKTRRVDGADPFWFLLWLSMSYGFTNFTWIWLLLDRDGHAVEWSLLPILGWITVGQLSQAYRMSFTEISISRGTGSYHGMMTVILLAGYLIMIFNNLKGGEKVDLLWLMTIGIGVQFAWEAVLLVSGIRPPMWQSIVINSLIETNLGMPYIYYIHKYITKSLS